MIDRKDCRHAKLTFGSGDFYIFCYECGAVWVAREIGSDQPAAALANQGIGSTLSGHIRLEEPTK